MFRSKRRRLSRDRGFTLIEVMVSVAVLSLGLAAVYEAFLVSLDTAGYFRHRAYAGMFIEETLGKLQERFDEPRGIVFPAERSGETLLGEKNFTWELQLQRCNSAAEMYRATVTVSWPEGRRIKTLSRTAMIFRQFSNVFPGA